MRNQDWQIIAQELVSVSFVTELINNSFLESEYFNTMEFGNENLKSNIKEIGIDNRGMLLMSLYALLLTPKEKIYDRYQTEYDELNNWINTHKLEVKSNYEETRINYVRHIRNSIGHSKVEFYERHVEFHDGCGDKKFCVKISHDQMGALLNELQKILCMYIEENM